MTSVRYARDDVWPPVAVVVLSCVHQQGAGDGGTMSCGGGR